MARSRSRFGRSASRALAVSVAVVVSACNSARLTSKRPAQGLCVPVLCPVGEVEAKGSVVAARMAGDEVSLLVDGSWDAWVVNGAGERDRIELPNEGPVHMENGDVSSSIPTWSVYKGAATEDGFVLLLVGPNPHWSHGSPTPNPAMFGLWRFVDGDVVWRQEFRSSEFRSWEQGHCLAVSGEEVAVAYPTDGADRFDQFFTVERRSLATGELLSSTRFDDANPWASAALRYTPETLRFAWAPEHSSLRDMMYTSAVGGSPIRVPRSRRYGEVALTPSGALAVRRAAPAGDRLMLDGDSILRSGRRSGLLTDIRAIETDKGTAVAFHFSGRPAHDRKAYSGIVGDSGVAIAFEHEPHTWESARREIVSVDSERLLLVEGDVQRSLSILTCAQSLPTAGLACETPEELRLRSGRDAFAR